MKVQTLIATMNQNDYSLLEKMNIQTDAIVGNQCNRNEISEFEYNHCKIKWLSFAEKGVGLNRNNTLMRAEADIVTFADDDMVFISDYEKVIIKAFEMVPQADIVIFDLQYPNKKKEPIKKIEKLSVKKCMRFGAARISVRLDSIRRKGVFFNLCFGGGTQYSSGEDSIFLADCIRRGLKVYSYPVVIAQIQNRESTWFKGYNEKFFYDKGVVFQCIYPLRSYFIALYHCVKHRKLYQEYGWYNAYKHMVRGIRDVSQ